MKRSGTVQPPAPPRQQPPPPHTAGTTAPTGERGFSHNVPSAGGTTPPPNHSRRRETQAADPRKAARRRAPPLAAGTPENPIARAGGRVSRGAGSHRISAHRRGEPPAPPLLTCDTHRCPERRYILCPVFGTPPHMDAAKKGSGAEAPPPFLILPTDTKSRPVRRSSPKRIPRRQAPGHPSWLESAVRCSETHHGTGTHPKAG